MSGARKWATEPTEHEQWNCTKLTLIGVLVSDPTLTCLSLSIATIDRHCRDRAYSTLDPQIETLYITCYLPIVRLHWLNNGIALSRLLRPISLSRQSNKVNTTFMLLLWRNYSWRCRIITKLRINSADMNIWLANRIRVFDEDRHVAYMQCVERHLKVTDFSESTSHTNSAINIFIHIQMVGNLLNRKKYTI